MEKIKKYSKNTLLTEVSMLCLVIMCFVAIIAHISSNSSWRYFFLLDGDSLTLPLIFKSLQLHEPVQWVFSSQLNLFPEFPLYVLARFVGVTVAGSLLVNALLNFLIIYVLIRIFIASATATTAQNRRLLSTITTLSLTYAMLLEVPTAYGQTLLTYILFNTYYFGPLIAGILTLSLIVLRLKKKNSPANKNISVTALCLLALWNTLTITSNPLFLVQFMAPFIVTYGLMACKKIVTYREVIKVIVATMLAPTIAAFVLRATLLKSFIGQDLGHYQFSILNILRLDKFVPNTLESIAPIVTTPGLQFRFLLSILLYYALLLFLLLRIRSGFYHKEKQPNHAQLFVLLFLLIQPIATILLLNTFGTSEDRHLITIVAMPILVLGTFINPSLLKKYRATIIRTLTMLLVILISVSAFRITNLRQLISPQNADQACLAKNIPSGANGIADYWVARQLDIYNQNDQRILQVTPWLKIYPWLNNISAYQNKDFTFYVHYAHPLVHANPGSQVENAQKHASRTAYCDNLVIYYYDNGTEGHDYINDRIKQSTGTALKARNIQ